MQKTLVRFLDSIHWDRVLGIAQNLHALYTKCPTIGDFWSNNCHILAEVHVFVF